MTPTSGRVVCPGAGQKGQAALSRLHLFLHVLFQ